MTSIEPQPPDFPPERPWFQFGLGTLLLVFVVLASSMAVFGAWGIVVFILVLCLAIYLREVDALWSRTHLALIVFCFISILGWWISPIFQGVRSGYRPSCLNRLKQIGLALHDYHQANGCFPPAYIADKNGKPMLSWRVLILPYLEENGLYNCFDLKQPWNAPKNKQFAATPLREFVCPADPVAGAAGANATNYLAVLGPNTAWAGDNSRTFADFGSHRSTTIIAIEVANSGIAWAEPRDLSLDTLDPNSKLPAQWPSSNHSPPSEFFFVYNRCSRINAVMADGSVQVFRIDGLSTDNLRKILQIGGCTREQMESYDDIYSDDRHLNWPNIAALAVWLLSVGLLLSRAVQSRNRKTIDIASNVSL